MIQPTCFEAIRDVDQAIRESLRHNVPYFMLGGIATAPLAEPNSFIDPDENQIFTTDSGDIPTIRDGGTKRDIDILVGDVLDVDTARKVKASVEAAVEDALEVSVFGFGVHEPMISPVRAAKMAGTGWTSRRTIDSGGVIRLELFPLIREIDTAIFEPWTLITPNQDKVSVMHPAVHVLNYATRSISGVRNKDREKLAKASKQVFENDRFVDDLNDGKLTALTEFSVMLDWLRQGKLKPDSPYLRPEATATDLAIARAKAVLLRQAESYPAIVDLALHGPIQRAFKPFIGNV